MQLKNFNLLVIDSNKAFYPNVVKNYLKKLIFMANKPQSQ